MTMSLRHTRLARHLSYYSLLGVLCFGLCLTSCRRTKPDQTPVETLVIAPGAQGWEALTMQLPAGSPAVVRMRPDATIASMDAAFGWFITDPAMFGEGKQGEEFVKGFQALRTDIASSFGGDPLALATWSDLGVALDAPAYIGFHPLSNQGRKFVQQVEGELAGRLDLPDLTLAEALKIRGEEIEVSGLYGAVNKASRHSNSALGVRVVLGLEDEARVLDHIDGVFSDESYVRVARVSDPAIRRVFFMDRNEDALTIVVRVEEQGKALVLDGFYTPTIKATGRDERQQEIMKSVSEVLARTPAGRAQAPAPSTSSVASFGMSQQGISEILRYISYREAIDNASSEAASRRDKQAYVMLGLSILQMSYWDTGARGIQGVNYELDVGGSFEQARRMFGFQMELFGEPGLAPPPVRTAARDLGVNESGVGLSMDPAMVFSEQWRTWLGPGEGVRLLDVLNGQFNSEGKSDLENTLFVVELPRLFAQLMTVIEDELKEEIPVELIPVYAQREKILRVEAVAPGLDLSNMWRDPNFVLVLTLDPELSTLDRDALSAALRDTLYYTFDFTSEPAAPSEDAPPAQPVESYKRAQALNPGSVSIFDAPATNALSEMYYYYERDGELPYIMLARGSQAKPQIERVLATPATKNPATTGSFRMKLDPSMLLQLANSYEEAEFSIVNLPILTQRVGPMLFNITPGTRQNDGVITYRFDLMAPSSLGAGQ